MLGTTSLITVILAAALTHQDCKLILRTSTIIFVMTIMMVEVPKIFAIATKELKREPQRSISPIDVRRFTQAHGAGGTVEFGCGIHPML
jgi:hypothetical protein